ncbi:MAG: M56 family metallopeptidase, partial [Pirellulaceae bacterium]
MNVFSPSEVAALLSSEFCVRLTQSLLHFLWQGVAVGLAVWILDRALRRASSQWRYAVGVTALLAMLACVPATYFVLGNTQQHIPSRATPAIPAADQSDTAVDGNTAALPVAANAVQLRPVEEVTVPDQPDAWTWRSLLSIPTWLAPYATLGYLLGVAIMLARLAVALWSGHQLRQSATPLADQAILAMVARQARRVGLKVAPAIAWCQRAAVPLVVGIVRPMILLPTAIASGLSPEQLEALLAHELAHLKRLDLVVNLVQRLAESLLFFHPAVWYVSRRISIERENCCDDCVLRAGWGRLEYADALVRMAEVCAAVRGITGLEGAALLAASGDHPSQFKRRVLRLLKADDHLRVGVSRG